MDNDTLVRTLALCVVLAGVETLHGIARTVLVVPRVGKARALRWSIVSGSLLAFGVCFLLVPGIGLRGLGPHLWLGLVLAEMGRKAEIEVTVLQFLDRRDRAAARP